MHSNRHSVAPLEAFIHALLQLTNKLISAVKTVIHPISKLNCDHLLRVEGPLGPAHSLLSLPPTPLPHPLMPRFPFPVVPCLPVAD